MTLRSKLELAAWTLCVGMVAAGCSNGGASGGRCTDTCRYARDGECDDGRPGAITPLCELGTDCTDCGAVPGGGDMDSGRPGGTPSECARRVDRNWDGNVIGCDLIDDCALGAPGAAQTADDLFAACTAADCTHRTSSGEWVNCVPAPNVCTCALYDFATGRLTTGVTVDFGSVDPCTDGAYEDVLARLQSECGWVPGPDRANAYLAMRDSGTSGDRDAGTGGEEPDAGASASLDAGPSGTSDAGLVDAGPVSCARALDCFEPITLDEGTCECFCNELRYGFTRRETVLNPTCLDGTCGSVVEVNPHNCTTTATDPLDRITRAELDACMRTCR